MDLKTALASVEHFYRRIYWQAPTATTRTYTSYTLSYSGIPWLESVNQLWLHDANTLDDALLEQAAAFFGDQRAEYSVVLTEEAPAPSTQWLTARRYSERSSNPIYALQGLPRAHNPHREATLMRASVDQQQVLLDVLYATFFLGPELGRCAVRADHFSDPTIRHYLAYVEGKVAACATVLLKDSVAGVWNVGTLREYRRQGIASALLMHALTEAAADGCRDSVLVASAMGRSLYEQMGYQLIGTSLFYGPTDGPNS